MYGVRAREAPARKGKLWWFPDSRLGTALVNAYGGALAKGTVQGTAIRLSRNLPSSKARIKQAYFTYIEAIISDMGKLRKDLGNHLVTTYANLNSFIDDEEANELIEISIGMKSGKYDNGRPEDKKKIGKYMTFAVSNPFNGELYDEINEFIGECYKKYGVQ